MTTTAPTTGVIPVLPTIFTDSGEVDAEGQARVVDHLVEAGSDALCVHANYSEQYALTDTERQQLLDLVADRAAGRIPLVVTTSHWSTRVAVERTQAAKDAGAAVVMLMPPFFGATLRASETEMLEHFDEVGKVGLPIMVQDAPMAGTALSVPFLAKVAAEVEAVRYVKVEVAQAAAKLRALAQAAGDTLPGLFDGEESITLVPDLEAGAVGTMNSASFPHEIGAMVRDFHAGRVEQAEQAWEQMLPLLHFENRQCGPQACKILLKEAGIIGSDHMRHPWPPLPAAHRAKLVELARRRDVFVLQGH